MRKTFPTVMCAGLVAGWLSLISVVALAQPLQKVALLPMSGSNVHPGYLEAGRDVFKDHLYGTGKYQVISVAGNAGNTEVTAEEAVTRGREVGADLALVTHLSRLSGTGRVRLVAYKVVDGSIAHADSIAIAGGPDDLDPALKRLAVGLATGSRAAQTADIESVTQKDADPLLKQEANKIFGLRLIASLALNRPGDLDAEGLPGIGMFWMYDARSFIGEVSVDLQKGSDDSGNSRFGLGIGAYYPFSRQNFTPYLGGSLSYAVVGGSGSNGIRIQPTFGFLFGRLSTVQLRGEIGYFFNTFAESRYYGYSSTTVGSDSSKTHVHGPQIGLGLGF